MGLLSGTLGKALEREIGKNTGKFISNKVFGDEWATPRKLIIQQEKEQRREEREAIRQQKEYDREIRRQEREEERQLREEQKAELRREIEERRQEKADIKAQEKAEKEYQKQLKEDEKQAKLDEIEDNQEEVKIFNDYLQSIQSIHKMQVEKIEWKSYIKNITESFREVYYQEVKKIYKEQKINFDDDKFTFLETNFETEYPEEYKAITGGDDLDKDYSTLSQERPKHNDENYKSSLFSAYNYNGDEKETQNTFILAQTSVKLCIDENNEPYFPMFLQPQSYDLLFFAYYDEWIERLEWLIEKVEKSKRKIKHSLKQNEKAYESSQREDGFFEKRKQKKVYLTVKENLEIKINKKQNEFQIYNKAKNDFEIFFKNYNSLKQKETIIEQEFIAKTNAWDSAWNITIDKFNSQELFKDLATKILAKDTSYYIKAIGVFGFWEFAEEFGSSISPTFSSEIIDIDFFVNMHEVVPKLKKTITKSGQIKETEFADAERNLIVQDYVCSSVIRLANESFALLPIDEITITATDKVLDTSTGNYNDLPILSVKLTREKLSNINLELIDPSDAIEGFEHNMSFTKSKGFSFVKKLTIKQKSKKKKVSKEEKESRPKQNKPKENKLKSPPNIKVKSSMTVANLKQQFKDIFNIDIIIQTQKGNPAGESRKLRAVTSENISKEISIELTSMDTKNINKFIKETGIIITLT